MRSTRQLGFVTIEWMLAFLISMMLLVTIVNITFEYFTTGAIRAVLADAVRAGSRGAATTEDIDAEQKCDQVVKRLLEKGGPWTGQVQLQPNPSGPPGTYCHVDSNRRISVSVSFCPSLWLPFAKLERCATGKYGIKDFTIANSRRVEYIRAADVPPT